MVYFRDGELLMRSGEVSLYKYNEDLHLEIGPGHTLWALGSELEEYIRQLSDFPRGKVLEIGLGLGVASRYILSLPKVDELTTVEINKDVISIQEVVKDTHKDFTDYFGYKKHNIINDDGLQFVYKTSEKFDFIFLDFYDRIDEDTLPTIEDVVRGAKRVLKPKGRIMGWFDPYTPKEFAEEFFEVFEKYY